MQPRRFSAATLAVSLVLALGACTNDGGEGASPTRPTDRTTTEPPATPIGTTSQDASPTPPALPEEAPLTRGQVDTDCVNGWVTPPQASARYRSPLGVIRRTTGVRGPLTIVDLRYFEGPESPPSDKGYLLVVQRWYVKLFSERDLSFQGRFLVEARRFGQGLAAVAPYDTNGYRSPDWIGFQYDGAGTQPRSYERLPGAWAGTPYDFVEGGEGITIPGLPDEVAGCLDAT